VKIVRHEKHKGKFVGFKNGIIGDYECSSQQADWPPVWFAGSTSCRCHLCPLNGIGASTDSPVCPAILGPEFINNLHKSEWLKEVIDSGPDGEADTTVILFGNALIINRNTACHRTSAENILPQ